MPLDNKADPADRNSGMLSNLRSDGGNRWAGRFSITVTLATAIGVLVLISVGSVLGVGVWLAQKNTFSLLSANAHLSVVATADQVKLHLQPTEHQTGFLAERIAKGEVDVSDRQQFGLLLTGALAAAPQIEAVMFIDTNFQAFEAGRDRENSTVVLDEVDYSQDPVIRNNMTEILDSPRWGTPVWRDRYQKTYLNLAHPVFQNEEYIGVIVAVVSVQQLSGFVRDTAQQDAGRRFILYDRDYVLAHPLLEEGYPGRSSDNPLPTVSSFEDKVLASIWKPEERQELALDLPQGTYGHVIDAQDDEYVFVYRELSSLGDVPLLVGAYFRSADVESEIRRMVISLVAGIVLLLLSLVCAIIVGQRIAQPIVRFSAAASRIRDLAISKVENLPGSVFRELNDQSIAFNTMLQALRWFELYVPRKVVENLIEQGDVSQVLSESREITVMFTDIAGYSNIAAGMPATEVADLLNHHFAAVAKCIEEEGGTVDKFIGDSVMAFWGAPESQDDTAQRACRAAVAIAAVIGDDNRKRVAAGHPPIRVRIGIHTGHATVGNIGAPGRLNYTIIGDTVNVGQQLEQLGKKLESGNSDVAILISGTTARKLDGSFSPRSLGPQKMKGHSSDVEAYQIG